MSRPTVSVVMPNYNHAQYLPGAIEELVNQTRPPDEFLILDDASTDDSVPIIQSYAERYSFIKVLRNERNAGVIEAHRQLFEASNCEYVYAGAADDQRLPDFLERAMSMAEEFPDAGLIFGQLGIADGHGRDLGLLQVRRWREPLCATPGQFLKDYLEVEAPSHSLCTATVYRRDALKEVGWYQPELEFWGDTFSARAIGLKYGACYVPERVAVWRRLSDSFSGQSRRDARYTLNMIAKAAHMMRGTEFRDCFPEIHIRRWERRYRMLTIRDDWLGQGIAVQLSNPKFWVRCFTRLPRLPKSLANFFYRSKADTTRH